jgi:hypothetical protein
MLYTMTQTSGISMPFSASPDKAAGSDGLTIRVWREVWPVLQQQIYTLFSTLLK